MSLIAPAALALGLLAVPILLLYMLRLRRREQIISSAMHWRELTRDRSANIPWQRLRRNLLLLLQLIILAALVLSLARPFLRAPGRVDGGLIVLLDASASMTATDGEGSRSRFEDAKSEVEKLIDGLGGADRMTLINVGRAPTVLAAVTSDRQRLRSALESALPENAAADWPAAFALAAGSAQGLSNPHVVVVSDGNLPGSLPTLPGDVSFIPVGRSGENLTIAAQAARPSGDGIDLLVGVTNSGDNESSALLSLYTDDVLFDSRRLTIAPGARANETWRLPLDAGVIEARLMPVDDSVDYLDVDDQAWSVIDSGGERRVMIVTEGNLFLERFFALLPGFSVVRASGSDSIEPATDGDMPFDLYVFDGVPIPDPLPPGNMLIFNPQPSNESAENSTPEIQVSAVFTNAQTVRLADDPLLDNVDWRGINVAEARDVAAPGLEPIIEAEGGPLLLAGEVDGRRVGIFTFDLHRSDLPLQIAFPVVMANITGWLNPGRVLTIDDNLQPGSTVTLIPNPRAEMITVIKPNGDVWEDTVKEAGEPAVFSETGEPGLYTVAYTDTAGESHTVGRFAINFNNDEESRIQPQPSIRLGQGDVRPDARETEGRREIWPWLLLAALAVLLVEWWVAYRRGSKRPFLKAR
jgi:hypothetical protein